MAETPVLQQMYASQSPSSMAWEPPEKPTPEPPKQHCLHIVLPMLLGILLTCIPLASILTLYLHTPCCMIQSTTVSTTTTSTSTTTTTTTTSTSTSTSTTTTTTTTTSTTTTTTETTAVVRQTYVCSGKSSHTLWVLYGTSGITMNIDTSNCTFTSTPLYFTSMAGVSSHWVMTSYTAIYSPTPTSFVVYARSTAAWNSTEMYDFAQLYSWDINWVGVLN